MCKEVLYRRENSWPHRVKVKTEPVLNFALFDAIHFVCPSILHVNGDASRFFKRYTYIYDDYQLNNYEKLYLINGIYLFHHQYKHGVYLFGAEGHISSSRYCLTCS